MGKISSDNEIIAMGISDSTTAPAAADTVLSSGSKERDLIRSLKQLVDKQAEDEGLWFQAVTAPEAYLQSELRKLHFAIEQTPLEVEG